MSDMPPPPPPSSMAPPPGYVGYRGPDFRSGGLRRVKGLGLAIAIACAVAIVGQVLSLATIGASRDAARDLLRTGDEDAFNEEFVATSGGAMLVSVASLALAVMSIIWLYRVTSNHRNLGRRLTWSAGWAIGGWFLPPILFVIPFLMIREALKASDPSSPPGTETWRSQPEHPLPWIWLLSFGVLPVVLAIANGFGYFWGFGGDADDIADRILDTGSWVTVAQGLGGIIAAAAWGALVWQLSQRHSRLTGEATAR